MYKLTLKRVRETIFAVEKQDYVFVSERVCPGAWACACSLAYPACNAYAPHCDVTCGPSDPTIYFAIDINGMIFGKKNTEHKICVFTFSTPFV